MSPARWTRLPRYLRDQLPVADLLLGARVLRQLPGFFRHPLTLTESRSILRHRLASRESALLGLARRAIYAQPKSPYRQLLALAGCEYGDLERLVRAEGVDGALIRLLGQGVYLTTEESKGRQPVVRGSTSLTVDPRDLASPGAGEQVPTHSGGSRGAPRPLTISLDFLRDRAVNNAICHDLEGGGNAPKGLWHVPGGGVAAALRFSAFGSPIARWFTQVPSDAPGLDPRYRRAEHVLAWGARLGRARMPRPEHVPVSQPLPVAQWLAEVLRAGQRPILRSFVSPAVRACQAAAEQGLDLTGAIITLAGEPVTAARLATIGRSGARGVPTYGSVETGEIGWGCQQAVASDDCHIYEDSIALVQAAAASAGPNLPPSAFFVSSLSPSMPLVLFNVSMGDQGQLSRRRCGCSIEQAGWSLHVSSIRSFEKLTAGGMTFVDSDIATVLDEVLPARFGGGPTHYQLLEEEDGEGRPRLRLLVDPAIGPVDEALIAQAFIEAIGGGNGAARVMGQVWQDSRIVQVDRRPPFTTARGKINHLHR